MLYQILKDYAGPVATIIASITAARITWYFASRQATIASQQANTAKQQANTAFDQLRLNLFEKRFAIYNAARELLSDVINNPNLQGSDIIPLQAKLNEAEFFFPQEICEWLRAIRKDCSDFLILRGGQHLPNAHTRAAEIASRSNHLFDALVEMPRRFESELGFRHVTRQP